MQTVKEAEKLTNSYLHGAEREIQQVLDAFPFYVVLVDSRHNIIAANNAVKQNLGLSQEQLIGAYCPRVIHDRDTPIAEFPLTEALEKGKAVEREVFDAKSGRWMNSAVYPTALITNNGDPVYLHYIRDITELKNTASELSRSLEHHRALCDLLQNLQYCRNSAQILEILINQVLSLSWLGMAVPAVGFLVKEKDLEMVAQRNVHPGQFKHCRNLKLGECLCGKVAVTGCRIVCSSAETEHTIRYEKMTDHHHAIIPLNHEGRTLGILNFCLDAGDQIDSFRLGFLDAAAAAAGAALAGQLAREEVKETRERWASQALSSQEEERKRVARELQEQLGQSLSALLLEVQSHSGDNELLKNTRDNCEARIRDLISQVGLMAKQLRPTILDDYGLEMALARHIEELSARTGLAIDYQYVASPEHGGRLPVPIEVGLYRFAVEALNNVVLHAGATQVSVIVILQPEKVVLLVEDDGRGFDYSTIRKDFEHCKGIISMEERVVLLGGILKVESTPQKGTTIGAEIPIKKYH